MNLCSNLTTEEVERFLYFKNHPGYDIFTLMQEAIVGLEEQIYWLEDDKDRLQRLLDNAEEDLYDLRKETK